MNAPKRPVARIDEESVERAVHYLAESAEEYARAKGRRVWLTEARKSLKAKLMLEADTSMSIPMREAYAYDALEYREHLEKLQDAIATEELLRAYRVAAEARIEVWRTLQANLRAANV
jgi:hypothetical protein